MLVVNCVISNDSLWWLEYEMNSLIITSTGIAGIRHSLSMERMGV